MTDAPEIHVLDHKVRLLQARDGFRTSMDSVFLAAACPAKPGERILDMGAGVGGASFCLLWRVAETHLTGIEIQESHATLARENILLNNMEGRADFIAADIRHYRALSSFDHVICNPPYLEAGEHTPSPSGERATALGHSVEDISLEDWVTAGFHNLRSGGSLTLIHRADALGRIILAMGRKFGATEIFPLQSYAGEEARRVIVRARKDRKTPLRLHAPVLLHEADGRPTAAADAVLRDGAAVG